MYTVQSPKFVVCKVGWEPTVLFHNTPIGAFPTHPITGNHLNRNHDGDFPHNHHYN